MHFIRIKKERYGFCHIARLSNVDDCLFIGYKKELTYVKAKKIRS